MAVKLNSSGGGSVTLDVGSTASNYTLTLPSASGTIALTSGSTLADLTVTGNTYLATSSGNVGIGTSSPAYKLDVNGSGALRANGALNLYVTNNANWSFIQNTGTNSGTNNLGFYVSGATPDMYISPAGNVGIGTSSPQRKLDVLSSGVKFANSGGAHDLLIGDDAYAYFGLYTPASPTYLAFRYNGTELMRIDSSGNVGIGTNSPGKKLDVVGVVRATNSGAAAQVNVEAPSGYANFVYWRETSVADRGVIGFSAGSGNMQVRVNGAYDLSSGTLASTINQYGIGLSTAVPSSGTGIAFPATQSASSDANTLDDYEEGSFTPTAFGSSTPGTTTYSSRSGYYVKVGRQVYVTAYLNVTNMTGTGTLYFGGFPYISDSNAPAVGSLMTNGLAWPTDGTMNLYVRASDTSAVPYVSRNNAAWNGTSVDTSFEVYYSATYYAAS